jgi:hypothetical protein
MYIWWMNFVPVVVVARVKEYVVRFGIVKIQDRIEVVVFCVMGLSGVKLVQGYGIEIQMLHQIYGRYL